MPTRIKGWQRLLFRVSLPLLKEIKMRVSSFGLLIVSLGGLSAYATPFLGSAGSFAVLGASTVTNTGATTLGGNLGVYPGTAITGSGTITLTGTIYTPTVGAPGVAQTAQADASTAYTNLGLLSPTTTQAGVVNVTGDTLGVGVYNYGAALLNTNGVLTLNFGGVADQNIVFQIGSTLTALSGSSVVVEHIASGDNVYWQVGSSATIGTGVSFAGDIIALTSVAMQTTA